MKNWKKWADKWLQYSKLIVIVSGIVFISILVYCLSVDYSTVLDVSIYSVAITITGGIFGSSIVWYEKKAQVENVAKIQLRHIKEVSKVEFETYEKKVRLQKELGILDAPDVPMDEEDNFSVDDTMGDAVDRDLDFLDSIRDSAEEEPELQSYN